MRLYKNVPQYHLFSPDNIVRYVTVIDLKDRTTRVVIAWDKILYLVEKAYVRVNPEIFMNLANKLLKEQIEDKWMVDLNKPNSKRIIPYMVANVIYEAARIVQTIDSQPGVSEEDPNTMDGEEIWFPNV